MKRKIDKIKNKRLVMGGGINNLSPNEILVEQKGDTISLKERINGEIKEVSGSGNSNEDGSSSWKYYDVSELNELSKVELITSMLFLKVKDNDKLFDSFGEGDAIIPYSTLSVMGTIQLESVKAMATDVNMKVIMVGREVTIGDALSTNPSLELATEITKEQFYSLE